MSRTTTTPPAIAIRSCFSRFHAIRPRERPSIAGLAGAASAAGMKVPSDSLVIVIESRPQKPLRPKRSGFPSSRRDPVRHAHRHGSPRRVRCCSRRRGRRRQPWTLPQTSDRKEERGGPCCPTVTSRPCRRFQPLQLVTGRIRAVPDQFVHYGQATFAADGCDALRFVSTPHPGRGDTTVWCAVPDTRDTYRHDAIAQCHLRAALAVALTRLLGRGGEYQIEKTFEVGVVHRFAGDQHSM